MKTLLRRFLSFTLRNKQGVVLFLCLFLSFVLWFVITYSKVYEHNEVFPIYFVDNTNKVEFYTKDSVVTVELKVNGFEFLANQVFSSHKKKAVIDMEELNLNLSKGYAKIPTSRLKPLIMKSLGYEGMEAKILPENINLQWKKVFFKKVVVVNKSKFQFKKPYEEYYPAELLVKEVLIEGNQEDLDKIDTLYTQNVTFKNIDKNAVFMVPLETKSLAQNVSCKTTFVPIRVRTEKYTENTVSIPINIVRYEDYANIKVFPKEVKIRYRVAIKDYNKVNAKDFNAYVLCSNSILSSTDKLKVNLNNIPDFVRVVSAFPEKVEYILYK
ncbi:MAG: hypothetical protein IJ180_10685 [Bacteroidales bacterium]|nr:hypothetical protein [Bacteroidales bacterium]